MNPVMKGFLLGILAAPIVIPVTGAINNAIVHLVIKPVYHVVRNTMGKE